ncbi:rab11 family-interacting protein 1 isoform X2 [Pempheris klunzingeri]|uniref:rab11 family-interacting protein 1 isoform X2 n=1 Tax=Pempheris klunzingeri TaxID=3127111 RepID=UPI00397F6218
MMASGETGSEGAHIPTLSISNALHPDLLPKLSDLQLKSNVSSQSDNENEKKDVGELSGSPEDFSKVLNDSSVSLSNTTDVMMTPTAPDDELGSTRPSLYIITSSPDVKQSLLDLPVESVSLGGQDASQQSPIMLRLLGDFLCTSHIANSTSQDFDDTLLHTRVSDQTTSSFLQSLYVSTDSQDYRTCGSHLSSKCSSGSEPNETLHSANSTLCGSLSEIQTAADDSTNAPIKTSNEEINQAERLEESLRGDEDRPATLEPSFMIGDDFGLQVLPAASTASLLSCNPRKATGGGVESQRVILGDVFSQSTPLHRSQSDGTLTPAFDELLVPSFGSDPGAVQGPFSAQPSPHLPSLTSFAPSLTPDSSSSPVALCSLPPFAIATARSLPSMPQAAAPQETQQQQEANQQNSPHPVKPLTTAILAEEKRTEGRSVLATGLEKLKSTIHPGRSSHLSEQEADRKKSATEGAGSYYHLTHSELVALLLQREAELEWQKAEFERQKFLLAKREVELKKLKPQVKDLEDYIDTLLVRIMEQKPTLLQVRSKLK